MRRRGARFVQAGRFLGYRVIPPLRLALDLPVGYVGAMGSRRTHDERLRLLREAGLRDGQPARLRSPIGLDLGARTAPETAVSITAEIIARTRHGSGAPLTGRTGPVRRACAGEAFADSGDSPDTTVEAVS